MHSTRWLGEDWDKKRAEDGLILTSNKLNHNIFQV